MNNSERKKAPRLRRTPTNIAGTSTCDARGLFPNQCMICKKETVKVRQKRQPLSKIITKFVENTLKQAAECRKDQEMLFAVQVDLIAKEFQRHEYCCREYTRVLWEKDEGSDVEAKGLGDFQAVCKLVDEKIIAGNQCLYQWKH